MDKAALIAQIRTKKSFLCVGLDSDKRKIPSSLLALPDPLFAFNKAIIDATAAYAVAYKPNVAFYEAAGVEGIRAFEETIAYLRRAYPEQFIIADAKRGDIGNTTALYARTFFEEYAADALTVTPYMGADAVQPYLSYEGRWVVVVALTSNKGAADFQFMRDKDGERLFERVLRRCKTWGSDENMMFVVGATQAEHLTAVRRIVPHHFLLVPGVGAQGGSLDDVCRYGMNADVGILVNATRSIIYASTGDDFAVAAGHAAAALQQAMAAYLP